MQQSVHVLFLFATKKYYTRKINDLRHHHSRYVLIIVVVNTYDIGMNIPTTCRTHNGNLLRHHILYRTGQRLQAERFGEKVNGGVAADFLAEDVLGIA